MGGTGPGPAGIAESKVGSNIDLRTHPRRIIVGAPIRGSDSGSILRSNTVGVAQTFMVFVKRGAVAWSTSEYKIWYVSVWLFLEARHEFPPPARW